MAVIYGNTNNILESIYSFIEAQLLADSLTYALNMEFKRAYDTALPVIIIQGDDSALVYAEIGDTLTTKECSVNIDIFARNNIEKNNIKDWIIEKILAGCDYKTYVTDEDGVAVGTATDYKVIVLKVTQSSIKLNVDKSQLDEHDKYRYKINLVVTNGKVS